jgi:hypothetical protein
MRILRGIWTELRAWLAPKIRLYLKTAFDYLKLTYILLWHRAPFDDWASRSVRYRPYYVWAVAFVILGGLLDPWYSMEVRWPAVYSTLSYEQQLSFVRILGLQKETGTDGLITDEQLIIEDYVPGKTPVGKKIIAAAGSLTVPDIEATLARVDPDLGRTFGTNGLIERRTRAALMHVFFPLLAGALLLALLPIHLLLAPPRALLNTTSRPYVLVTAASLVIYGIIKLIFATPLDLVSYAHASEGKWYIPILQNVLAVLLFALYVWYIWKQVIYLKATYSRSGVRTLSAVLVGQATVLAAMIIVAFVLARFIEPYLRDYL